MLNLSSKCNLGYRNDHFVNVRGMIAGDIVPHSFGVIITDKKTICYHLAVQQLRMNVIDRVKKFEKQRPDLCYCPQFQQNKL